MRYITSLLFIFSVLLSSAQTGKVSSRTNIKKGVLDNGFTYYLYNNPVSQGKADFYLLQDVGAILEEDSQDGLAHFLEHMCFKGTEFFPGRTIFDLLESKSLSNSINAYTGIEETVYYLKDIPTKDRPFFDQCLIILRDWCDNLLLEDDQIEPERDVIVEELRMRRNLQQRIMEGSAPYIYNNSQYSKRFIGGTPDIIKNFHRSELERFYNDWYRTDLQSLVIVGDIDVYDVEKRINNFFSLLPKVENPKEKPIFSIDDNEETIYGLVNDDEVVDGQINIYFRKDHDNSEQSRLNNNLINMLFSRRMTELIKNDTLNLVSASIANQKMNSKYDSYIINLSHKPNKAKESLELVINAHKDVLENSFTQEELDFVLDNIKKESKMMALYKNGLPNDYHFQKIKSNFIDKEDSTLR